MSEIKKLSTYIQRPFQNGFIGNIFNGKTIREVSYTGTTVKFTNPDESFQFNLDARDAYTFWWSGSNAAIAKTEVKELIPNKVGFFIFYDAANTPLAFMFVSLDADFSTAQYTESADGTFGNVGYL